MFDIDHVLAIKDFAKGEKVVDMGAGTGYNAWLFSQVGIDVCAVDRPQSMFPPSFFKVQMSPPSSTSFVGTMLYIWPEHTFPWLEEFIQQGGTRVVVAGDHSPDHFYKDAPNPPPICPVFPPESHAHLKWDMVYEQKLPVSTDDVKDVLQFFVLKK